MFKKFIFIFLVLALLILYIDKDSQPANNVSPSPSPKIELDSEKLWNLVNEYRLSKNLPAFIKHQDLCKIAQERAPEIKNEINDPHSGFLTRYKNYPYRISENGETSAIDEQDALGGWIKSAPHHQALLADWQYSCIACSDHHCVQIFSNFKEQ